MGAGTVLSTVSNITLVTLQGFPADIVSTAKIFKAIGEKGINVDMISMAPTHGAYTGMSFTISDSDLIEILAFTNELKKKLAVNVIVSSVNHKISIYDKDMKNAPGFAAGIFAAIEKTDADIRLITTSEVEISMLVTETDFDTVYDCLKKTLGA